MIAVKILVDDPQYTFQAIPYPGMTLIQYLKHQLDIWIDAGHPEFNVELDGEFSFYVPRGELLPKTLAALVESRVVSDTVKRIRTNASILQSPAAEMDGTGTIPLFYVAIDLGSKRAETSLMRLLDIYMLKTEQPSLADAVHEEIVLADPVKEKPKQRKRPSSRRRRRNTKQTGAKSTNAGQSKQKKNSV